MRILYYDCFSGISGDMNLGAMIDLGVDPGYLMGELRKLGIDRYELEIKRDQRKGITGTRINILLHNKKHTSGYPSLHRSFKDIVQLIDQSQLSEKAKVTSLNILATLAQAEAKVHGHEIEDVQFHEVGAIDSIVDIVGAAVCLDYLKVDRVLSSAVQVGGGFVKCEHGTLPVPTPATAEILRGIPIKSGIVPFETTTPTGAAILAATVDEFTEHIHFAPSGIGYGIGQRDTEIPNVLRIMLGNRETVSIEDVEIRNAFLVECNIDDMNPELYDDIMDTLFENGALDVYLTPVIMKKSRPAIIMGVICNGDKREGIEKILLLQTSTFGLRTQKVTKTMLRRDFTKKSTRYGEITIKNAYYNGRKIKSKPEYEDCKKLAKEKGVSLKEIYDGASSEDG
jgi:pyridinium-3,5-bisthiocarboxylic acid mononucleotide nickel chelatase